MKNKKIKEICGICAMVLFFATVVWCGKSEERAAKRIERQVERTLRKMTTREKVAQLIVSQTDSYIFSEGHALMTDTLVGIEGIGGLLIIQDSLPRFLTRMNQLQEMSKIPLLVSIDGEWGPSMRFSEFPFFPQQMQLGALASDSLIYEMGLAVAEQCKMANIHINYAPVVDINVNPKNPVIHARSFGENRDKVTAFGRAYMKGMQDGGIIACSKHFPGHGDTEVDSHKGLPVLPFSRERLDSLELYPFRDQIKHGVEMVMMGHLHIPALDSAVSSISYPIVTGLLRQELGFEGIIVTDALTMKGVSENMESAEIALAAYKAGVDILLKPGDIIASIDRLEAAMNSGECDIEELNERVRKTLRMKARFGMLERNYDATVDTTNISERVKKPEHIALIQEMADQSMTLVDNKLGIVPIDMTKKIAYVAYNAKRIPMLREYGDIEGLSGYNPETGMVDSTTLMYQHLLKEAMTQGGDKAMRQEGDVHYFALDKKSSKKDIAAVEKQLSDYDVVILACHDPRGRSRKDLIAEEHVAALESLIKKHHPILVHYGSPYGLSNLPWKQELGGLLVAYKDSESNQKAAAKVLTGEIEAIGELPVSVE
jgi:beta-glucosidase-like glycosyl hydrolase